MVAKLSFLPALAAALLFPLLAQAQDRDDSELARVLAQRGWFDLAEETFLDWVWGNRTGSLSFTRFLGDDAFVELQAQGSEYESIAGARFFSEVLRKGDLERRIRDLGSLPDEAFEKYRGLSLKRLQQELAQVRRGSW